MQPNDTIEVNERIPSRGERGDVMSPGQVLGIFWRRSWIAALTLVSAIVVAGGVLLFVPGRYDAVATASIDPGRSDPINGAVGMRTSSSASTKGT